MFTSLMRQIFTFLIFSKILLSSAKCGYESCPETKSGYLNVHLVPHSHDDMGWLKTVDQYYYGANNSIQSASVQYILDSVVDEISKDPKRRFIYVESGFFWRWWKNQDEEITKKVIGLVESGQLEFINGGWVMNDEGTTHYNEIIDQMSLGLRFLSDVFGICGNPRVAWQIDPFGHSREQASLLAQMGFDGLFFGRLDYQDKEFRRNKKELEMIWSGSPKNLGRAAWLFTGALFNGYNPPNGFCWDISCYDDPLMDDPQLLGYNLQTKIHEFLNATREWASAYQTNHILMTMGSDFQYMAAKTWFKNMDKLIKHINSNPDVQNDMKVNLIYSTPSCYLQEVHRSRISLNIKRDDFFPYASSRHSYWTGYFTSRSALKYFVRYSNNFLQACKQLVAANRNSSFEELKKLEILVEAMAVAQHHDAISGTAKQHVTYDYAVRLSSGIAQCEDIIATRLLHLKELNYPSITEHIDESQIQFCHLLNISQCSPSENMKTFFVHIYNPLGSVIPTTYIRIPVKSATWTAFGEAGETISLQAVPIPTSVFNIPGRISSANTEVVIPIHDLQPLTFQTIQLEQIEPELWRQKPRDTFTITSEAAASSFTNKKGVGFTIDENTGLLRGISNGVFQTEISQNFYYYHGTNGTNTGPEDQASGAYIFRPNGSIPIPVSKSASYIIFEGEHMIEVQQSFNSWISQVIRLYHDSEAVEFEYQIGPIPVEDEFGKEVVTRYSSDLNTKGVFYTDANGREIIKRTRDLRPTWQYQVFEPVAGNYYPVNTRMIIQDEDIIPKYLKGRTLALVNDRSQGCTSMNDGEMELMLHRRLLVDDGFGVGEALNETAFGSGLVIRGKHWLILTDSDHSGVHRKFAQQIYRRPILMFQKSDKFSTSEVKTNEISEPLQSGTINTLITKLGLPENIHLLTFERLGLEQCLVRLEHFYERGEDATLSQKTIVPISILKAAFGFKGIREATLGGNQFRAKSHRMDWTPNSVTFNFTMAETPVNLLKIYNEKDPIIEFQPMEIKTFILFY